MGKREMSNQSQFQPQQQQQRQQQRRRRRLRSSAIRSITSLSIYLFSIVIYLLPISSNRSLLEAPLSVLDEVHILSNDNIDSNPPFFFNGNGNANDNDNDNDNYRLTMKFLQTEMEALKRIFRNDYWGRDMNLHSSHKSYRPLTVLSFRYTKYLFRNLIMNRRSTESESQEGEQGEQNQSKQKMQPKQKETKELLSNLFLQRVVNIILHSTIVQMMHCFVPYMIPSKMIDEQLHFDSAGEGSAATMVYIITILTQLFFILHPTHCEVVVNVANRGHLLSVLFGLWLSCYGVEALLPSSSSSSSSSLSSSSSSSSSSKNRSSPDAFPMMKLGILYICGLLSSETFVFFLPILVVTWLWILVIHMNMHIHIHVEEEEQQGGEENDGTSLSNTKNSHCTATPTTTADKATTITLQIIRKAIHHLLPRITLIITMTLVYLYIRHVNDWISIPDGLIRPAENPFVTILREQNDTNYFQKKMKYHINYMYILSVHVIKSLGMGLFDIIGLSHEYGYNCIPEIQIRTKTMVFTPNGDEYTVFYVDDERLWILLLLFLCFIIMLVQFVGFFDHGRGVNGPVSTATATATAQQQRLRNNPLTKYLLGGLLWIVICAWIFSSLFPVSGFMKIGTFVADRLVVPSTVITSLFWASIVAYWIISPLLATSLASVPSSTQSLGLSTSTCTAPDDATVMTASTTAPTVAVTPTVPSASTTTTISMKKASYNQIMIFMYRCVVIVTILSFLSIKIYKRSTEWMTPKSLLESSLRVCPQSAKSNLEYSKIYSGLYYPKIYNLNTALEYITRAEEIDGTNYCDVHYQFAYIYFQQEEYLQFEERVTKGVLCPFTMHSSYEMFQQYWKAVLNSDQSRLGGSDARIRYQNNVNIIQNAIKEEEERNRAKKENSDVITTKSFNQEL